MNRGPDLPNLIAFFTLSADARIAQADGTPIGTDSALARQCRALLRHSADVILLGRNALNSYDPDLPRPETDETPAPDQIHAIISAHGHLDLRSPLFRHPPGPIHLFTTQRIPAERQRSLATRATIHIADSEEIDLADTLRFLRSEHSARRVLCEGGAHLFRSLVEANLVDELHVVVCPQIIGGEEAPTLLGPPREGLPQSIQLELISMHEQAGECHARYRFPDRDP